MNQDILHQFIETQCIKDAQGRVEATALFTASDTAPQAPQLWKPVVGADGPGRAEPTGDAPASPNGAQGPAQAANWAPATATPEEVERRARIVAAIARSQARPPKRAWGRR